jgi:uncharacterized GH25 family protein
MTSRFRRLLLGIAAATMLATPALAHRQWLLPSATVVSGSGDDMWVTVDAAVSNDLFYFEHQPLRLDNVKAYAPDGTEVPLQHSSTGRYRSTFDVQLTQPGTYKIANVGGGIMGSYKVNGQEQRLPRGTRPDQIASIIPAGATDVTLTQTVSRNETFVTFGQPTTTVFTPTRQGIELVPVTHPNDLVVGEPGRFRFLVDGQPAANLTVTVVPGGIRYRNQLNDRTLHTDANGEVSIDWPTPGFYWISAEISDNHPSLPGATQRRLSYITTLEVMPS